MGRPSQRAPSFLGWWRGHAHFFLIGSRVTKTPLNDRRAPLADIRRLVYDLRPPSLDELGLVGALRERAAQVTVPTGALLEREP